MRLYQNKSINPALRIPLKRGNKLFSRFSVMLPLTNGGHYIHATPHFVKSLHACFQKKKKNHANIGVALADAYAEFGN